MKNVTTIKVAISKFSAEELHGLVIDAEKRIGSHVASGYVNETYIKKQREFIELIADELNGREMKWKSSVTATKKKRQF